MEIKEIKTINDYQVYFDEMYSELNNKRDWQEIYGYLARTSGYLSQGLIKNKATVQHFVRPISWLFALSNKFDIDLQESFFRKYPGICHYCVESVCNCFRSKKTPKYVNGYDVKVKRNDRYQTILNGNAEKSLDYAVRNISNIYPNNEVIWHFSGPWMNCAKLFEEVSELHEAISKFKSGKKKIEHIEQELADVLAWILSSWACFNRNESLDDSLKGYFSDGCPVCHHSKCRCSNNDARIQGLIDGEQFAELRVLFEELQQLSPDAIGDIESLVTSLKEVEKSEDEAVANATVKQAEQFFNKIKDKLNTTEEVTRKAASISKSIMTLINMIS